MLFCSWEEGEEGGGGGGETSSVHPSHPSTGCIASGQIPKKYRKGGGGGGEGRRNQHLENLEQERNPFLVALSKQRNDFGSKLRFRGHFPGRESAPSVGHLRRASKESAKRIISGHGRESRGNIALLGTGGRGWDSW